jgi:hypothetical protein
MRVIGALWRAGATYVVHIFGGRFNKWGFPFSQVVGCLSFIELKMSVSTFSGKKGSCASILFTVNKRLKKFIWMAKNKRSEHVICMAIKQTFDESALRLTVSYFKAILM